MTLKNTLLSLMIILTIGVAAWTTVSLFYHTRTVSTTSVAMVPDAYMEDVTATVYDKQGKPSLKIVTPKLVHYATDDTSQMMSPQLTIYRKSPQPWFISSHYAKSTHGADLVKFWDDVIIHHAADENNPATVIRTTSLDVRPNDQIAETKDVITLVQPNIEIKATGLFADLNSGDIKLLSNAKGEYVPNS